MSENRQVLAKIQGVNNILAIRFMRLGDVVLLLPALIRLKECYPGARLTLLTDVRCAPLAELCPSLDEVIGVDRLGIRDGSRVTAVQAMRDLVQDIRSRHFDLVIDFLSFRETNLLAWLSGAPFRLGMERYDRAYLKFCFNLPPVPEDKKIHVSEMFQRVVAAVSDGRNGAPSSCRTLTLAPEITDWAAAAGPPVPFVTLYVGAPVPERRWPAENFAKIAEFAVKQLNACVAVIAGAPDGALARQVQELSGQPDRVFAFDNVSVAQMSGLISRAQLLVSNDTGPMHIGPAFDIATLGLFSVGFPEHYRPLGTLSRFLRAEPIESISVEDVIRNLREMWSSSNPSDSLQKLSTPS